MGVRFVRSAGSVHEPAVVNLLASGTIYANSVVIRDVAANGAVSYIAGTGITTTNAVGVSLDYVQGASDTFVRVIPFVQGQLWEVDAVNAAATSQVGIRHTMLDGLRVTNITSSVYGSASTGVFLAYAITGSTSGSGKLIGTFLTDVPFRAGMTDNLG